MPSGDAFEGGAPLATQLGRKQPHGNWDSKQHFGHEAGRKSSRKVPDTNGTAAYYIRTYDKLMSLHALVLSMLAFSNARIQLASVVT